MSASRIVRPRVLRSVVVLATLLSLLCLVLPSEAIRQVDLLGMGRHLGVGKAAAADVIPVTVDNSTSGMALMSPTQRKLFQAAGRFWLFYSDGTDLVYKSSSDGLSWSAKSASLGTMTSGDGMSVHFDGTYVHLVRTTDNVNEPLYYRRGVPGADGTIAWSAAEQIAVGAVNGVRYVHPSVSVDSSGHALVSYHYEKQSGKAGEGPWIAKSANSDGTWGAAAAGFPYQLAADSESEWYTTVHGLTSDKIAVTFADHTNIKGVSIVTYDGANWSSVVSTASDPQSGSAFSTVTQGDDLHIALLTTATYDIVYCRYTYSANTLSSENTLLSTATASSFPALARDSNNDLYCLWAGAPVASHIYHMRMVSGVWDAACTDWVTETNLVANGGVSAFYDQGGSNYIGVAWETGTASPYDVRFAAVSTYVAPNQIPNQPSDAFPANGETGQTLTPTLQSSGFLDPDSGDTHGASQWQIRSVSEDYTSPLYDSMTDNVNLLSIPVPAGKLSFSTTYYWHVRHQDNHGDWSEWSVETSFSTTSAPNQVPNQPSNALPANGESGQTLMPTLQSSGFVDPDAGDTHGASQWQITATSGNYTSPVFDSLTDNANLLSILVPAGKLSFSTTYYWHVRHQDNHGDWSEWSVETSFSTTSAPNQVPNWPSNALPADGESGQTLTPTLQSSGFLDPDSGDTHGASQWQITANSGNYASPVFDTLTDSANLLSIPVPAGKLSYSTIYYWRVRHQDNHGDWSDWSVETSFSTTFAPNQVPNQPSNALPANGESGQTLTPTLESSTFSDPDAGDIHGASQWQITATSGNYASPVFDTLTDNANLLSIPVPAGKLSFSTTCYWHVRHQDNHGDWSEWSAETSFSTAAPTEAPEQPPDQPLNEMPNQPRNTFPVNAADGQGLTPTLQSSGFDDPDVGDTHSASQWQIRLALGDYSSPMFDSQTHNVNLVSILVPSGKLSCGTTYYWRVRHQDNHGDWSEWSAETHFVTNAAPDTTHENPDGEDTAPTLPDANDSRGVLPFVVSVAAGVAAVGMGSSILFLGYRVRVRLANQPKGLRSARTISKRLRK